MKLINVPGGAGAEVFDWLVISMGLGLMNTLIGMKPCFCMSSCLKENVPAACSDAVTQWVQSWYVMWHPYSIQSQHVMFLLLFLSDDKSLSVTWCLRIAKKLYKEVNVYLSWWQRVGCVSWSAHFKQTKIENDYGKRWLEQYPVPKL